jgi:hypothetical protein
VALDDAGERKIVEIFDEFIQCWALGCSGDLLLGRLEEASKPPAPSTTWVLEPKVNVAL